MRISNTMLATIFLVLSISGALTSARAGSLADQHNHHEIDVEQQHRAGSLGWLARRLGLSGCWYRGGGLGAAAKGTIVGGAIASSA